MIIYDTAGKILFRSSHRTMKATLEDAVARGVRLQNANLRRIRLRNASLDGLSAKGACLWGADMTGADIGLADLRGADLRMCELKDTCFAESDLSGCDLRGAYFSDTLLEGAVIENCHISCPSFWGCDLKSAYPFSRLVYTHQGEEDLILKGVPLIVRGIDHLLVMIDGVCLWGNKLYRAGSLPPDLEKGFFKMRATMDRILPSTYSRSAKKPIPKISKGSYRD